jgi:beta-glucosidase
MHRTRLLSLLAGIALCGALGAQTLPYQDASLSAEQRADDLLGRLSLQQKVSLMMNASPAIPEFGIREYNWWSEALHGAARAGLATVFPQAIGMAASWDDALLEEVFDITSTEQRIKFIQYRKDPQGSAQYHGLTVWTPNINIFRDPRWGRGQETYGEDPYLTAKMGYAVVKGLQGPDSTKYDKLHACLKHYAVHSGPEGTRHQFNARDISWRDLAETYLYAFGDIISRIDVQEVMCAYNRFEDEPCCGSDQLLIQFLRGKWGYKGLVVSDCGAIDDFWREGRHGTYLGDPDTAVARAVRTGTDLECGNSYEHLLDAVKAGKLTEADIDVSLRRLLVARFRLGEMDPDESVSWNHIDEALLACDAHRAKALEMARESLVLLQNRHDFLPLRKDINVAVIGPNAADSVAMWGNYNGFPVHTVTVLEGITAKVGADHITSTRDADVVIYVGGISPRMEGEEMRNSPEGFNRGDRTTIELPRAQREEIEELRVLGKRIVFVNFSGSAMGLLPETERCEAILQAWYPGEAGGTAVADVLFGDCNPSGRLPVTFYRSDADLPDFNDYDMASGHTYRYFQGEPLFAFGHGLSYSRIAYSRARVWRGELVLKLRNRSRIDGDEVVQLYVRKHGDEEGPRLSLRSFQRVHVPARKSVTVRIPLDDEVFAAYDEASGELRATPGRFSLYYGSSSARKDLKHLTVSRRRF